MKITIAILITSICLLFAQDAPITPDQRFNLPPAGRTIDGKPFDYNSMSDTNISAETRRKVRGEPSAREKQIEERRKSRTQNNSRAVAIHQKRDSDSTSTEGQTAYVLTNPPPVRHTGQFLMDGEELLFVEILTNIVKQRGATVTNRVAILTYDGVTNVVTLKTLGRTVRRAQ